MPDCAACQLFQLESEGDTCLHVNRPGGLILTEEALDICRLPIGANVLDVASGVSTTLKYLIDQRMLNAVGLDLSLEMLRLGRKRYPELCLMQANCGQVPLRDASQQMVMMECALSLTGSSVAALAEFERVLEPGGKLVVTDIYIREVADPAGIACLSATHCLAGTVTEDMIRHEVTASGFMLQVWQDQTTLFKQWLGAMVFKLGSLEAFYRQLATCESKAESLGMALGKKIKLGYYLLIAEKRGS